MGKDLKGKELGEKISQRKDGAYCARYINRFGKRISIYDKDLRVLKQKFNDALYEDKNQLNIIEDNCTLDMWFDKWLNIYKAYVIRENTKLHYTHIYNAHISPALGLMQISQITKLQITALIKKLKSQGLQWETQNKVRVLLLDMFNRALDDNFVKRNPAKGVRTASNRPKNERRVLTREDQATFFDCASGTFYNNLFTVAVNTGLRPGELFALTWDDIDLENRFITVSKTLVYQKYLNDTNKTFHLEDPKTESSKRKVPINSICEKALKQQYVQKKVMGKNNPPVVEFPNQLFTTKYNTPLNSVLYSDAIQRIVNEVNLIRDTSDKFEIFSGHTFRHTFATRCIESGIKPKTLQTYLGHANIKMTMDLYVHTTDETQEKEILLLEKEFEKIGNDDSFIERKFKLEIENSDKIYGVQMA